MALSPAARPRKSTKTRSSISSAIEIVAFWRESGARRWFAHDPQFDRALTERFEADHLAAARGALSGWEDDATGALALVILTDQFPRNIYRNSAHAFATDPMARAVAERAIERDFDRSFEPGLRQFFYLPCQHQEDAGAQARGVALHEALVADGGDPRGLDYARLHAGLIARFGRFPHRNAVMGRVSTPEEIAYLANGGFAG